MLVSFFTRDQGKVIGVARHAMRSRRRFGGALEPMTEVRATWAEKAKQDVVRLDNLEILWSPLRQPVDYARAAALAVVAEVLEAALPERAPEDDVYRLAIATIREIGGENILLPVTYFLLWLTRLLGWMPELHVCAASGEPLRDAPVYFSPQRDGFFHAQHRPSGSLPISAESLALAERIFRSPIRAFQNEAWPRTRAADLRRFTAATMERNLETRLISLRTLARL